MLILIDWKKVFLIERVRKLVKAIKRAYSYSSNWC